MSTKHYFLIVLAVVATILGSFYSGYFLKSLITSNYPTGLDDNNSQVKFKPNFIDEIIIVTKDIPHRTLILSSFRTFADHQSSNYSSRAFYFDGYKWDKNITEGKVSDAELIPKTSAILSWKVEDDPSYMLKQSVSGEVAINYNRIKFDIPSMYNEIGIRSSPKYTKFMSEIDGVLTINDEAYDSHILYSRIYSFNPPESLIFTTDPSGIETEWLAFWDTEGNFYTIDETIIDNKRTLDSYKAHSLAVFKNKDDQISKSFTLNLEKDNKGKYTVQIGEEIDKSIFISKLNSVNKAINGTDVWFTGQANGKVKTEDGKIINGFGIFEQISQ